MLAAMTTIRRDLLHSFIDSQLDRVLATPVPPDLAALAASERFDVDEARALWVGAGIASQIGLALAFDPGRFVEPWPERDDEPARLAV